VRDKVRSCSIHPGEMSKLQGAASEGGIPAGHSELWFMESPHTFLARIGTRNLACAVAAEVTRRTEAGVHIFPPRYLGGYVPVHGESGDAFRKRAL